MDQPRYYIEKGVIQAVDPPESHFGFSYWSLMIPPICPNSVLMLGCGEHTIPKLIERIWGLFDLTCNEEEDAFEFVKTLKGRTFDYIIIDLFDGSQPIDRIASDNFVQDIAELSNGLVAVNSNTTLYIDRAYRHHFEKVLEKRLNNNVVTFMKRNGVERQYFAVKP